MCRGKSRIALPFTLAPRTQVLTGLGNMALDPRPPLAQDLASQEVMDSSSEVTDLVNGPPWP